MSRGGLPLNSQDLGKLLLILLTLKRLEDGGLIWLFPSSQFIPKGFTPPDRLDRTQHGGGINFFIREDIPSKLLNADTSIKGTESLFVEINLRSKKWLISGSYNHI